MHTHIHTYVYTQARAQAGLEAVIVNTGQLQRVVEVQSVREWVGLYVRGRGGLSERES